jgi:MFS superfamily sulfate permease-like transporter
MGEFWYYIALIACMLIGLRSLISGLKGKSTVLWLSMNSASQSHYEKYACIYNIIIGTIITLACGIVLVKDLL